MNEKKFVVVRVVEDFRVAVGSPDRFHYLYVSDIYRNNGFSSHIEDAMGFEEFQADTIEKALETIETIHYSKNRECRIEVHYEVKEIQK